MHVANSQSMQVLSLMDMIEFDHSLAGLSLFTLPLLLGSFLLGVLQLVQQSLRLFNIPAV